MDIPSPLKYEWTIAVPWIITTFTGLNIITMKKSLAILLVLLSAPLYTTAQTLPLFLQGTWKMEGKAIYEHWNILSGNSMKGVSYAVDNNQVAVIEYLDISGDGAGVLYTAVVPGHNQGQAIPFRQTANDSLFVFENPRHDFPQKIVYRKWSDTEITVQLSGGENEMSYKMTKYPGSGDAVIYDKALAESLGADEYGMKRYVFVILKTGQAVIEDRDRVNEIFRGHLDNISRLAEKGKLTLAGPLMKNEKEYRGIYILTVQTIEEAAALLETDPAIAAGLLEPELFSWYGSAALPTYMEAQKKIEKLKP